MNKRVNTVLFMLGATVVNVLLMFLIFLVFFVLYGRFLAPHLADGLNRIALLVLFVASMVITYIIYHRAVRALAGKYDLEKYFDPIFGGKGKPPRR